MKVKVLGEYGYEWALLGLSKSFKKRNIPHEEWWTKERFHKLQKTATGMAHKDGGHNKFLESINVWMDIEAPRGFWQEYDTYRVGMTKQSDSTMHTIQKGITTMEDYEPDTDYLIISRFNDILAEVTDGFKLTSRLKGEKLQRVKWALPEGFLQSRVVCTNYKTLRNQIVQRYNHNLVQWQQYIKELYKQLEHPELLPKINLDKQE
jgi:hypothetical protein